MEAKTRSRRHVSFILYFPENLAMTQMSAFTQAILQTAKTQSCAVSSHFFCGVNKRGFSPSAIFAQQLCVHHTSGPIAARVQNTQKGEKKNNCLGSAGNL